MAPSMAYIGTDLRGSESLREYGKRQALKARTEKRRARKLNRKAGR